MKKIKKDQQILIYQTKAGAIEIKKDAQSDTIWATQAQIVKLFGVDQSVVSRHIRNVFKDREIEEKSNMQKMHNANSDKPVTFYSLDVILSVGYRTNSKVAIEFRRWATKTLRSFAFAWFLNQAKMLYASKITPPALTALTILVAESNPKEKDKVIHLILALLSSRISG